MKNTSQRYWLTSMNTWYLSLFVDHPQKWHLYKTCSRPSLRAEDRGLAALNFISFASRLSRKPEACGNRNGKVLKPVLSWGVEQKKIFKRHLDQIQMRRKVDRIAPPKMVTYSKILAYYASIKILIWSFYSNRQSEFNVTFRRRFSSLRWNEALKFKLNRHFVKR